MLVVTLKMVVSRKVLKEEEGKNILVGFDKQQKTFEFPINWATLLNQGLGIVETRTSLVEEQGLDNGVDVKNLENEDVVIPLSFGLLCDLFCSYS